MYDLKACVVCFNTDVKLFNMNNVNLRQQFVLISGIQKIDDDGLPHYLCYQCSGIVRSFMRFRERCHRAYFILKEILSRNKEIKLSYLKEINRNHLGIMPLLSYMDKIHLEQVEYHEIKQNSIDSRTSTEEAHCTSITFDNFNSLTYLSTETDTDLGKNIKIEVDELLQEKKNETEVNEENVESYLEDDIVAHSVLDSDNYDEDNNQDLALKDTSHKAATTDNIDELSLDEEYATMVSISMNEAQAAVEVCKMYKNGQYKCEVCHKTFGNENRLADHLRKHEKHTSGIFECVICKFYYKTDFLLKTHMTEKHKFKYLCKKCPEVSFDRTSAKQHFVCTHLRTGSKKDSNWYEIRPSWLMTTGGKKNPGVVSLKPKRKPKRYPDDYPICTVIPQEEQYLLVKERQNTKSYLDANYKCSYCYKGFRVSVTYEKHMRKHDPAISGPLQCDMCKMHFKEIKQIYKHMVATHVYKYSCQMCSSVCTNEGPARLHYKWHKNVTYPCPHCGKVFMALQTRLSHIRIKHPSLCLCNLCGHSFVSESGVHFHKKKTHTKEEIELSENMEIDKSDPQYCADCDIQFLNVEAFKTHLGSSFKHSTVNFESRRQANAFIKNDPKAPKVDRRCQETSDIVNKFGRTSSTCEVCGKWLASDLQARKHYQTEHPDTEYLKRYMCDVCGHTTKEYCILLTHMRTHTKEKPYECPHCDKRFIQRGHRDTHITVHTGEKKYECQHCKRRFTQNGSLKLHIQTVHLKIPYAPWNKKNRQRRKEKAAGVSKFDIFSTSS